MIWMDLEKFQKIFPMIKFYMTILENHLPAIPDPFQKYGSFGEHNNKMLIEFLKKFNFNFIFKSSTENYKKGIFNNFLRKSFEKFDDIMNIILPTLGKRKKKNLQSFFTNLS